ncbi:MAG: transcriptional regulator [Proteobacteria bacterium]|nr:transcriptional regulator [Pseudomonadota bacterium]
MKIKNKKPFVPVEREETIRKGIISILRSGNSVSAKDLSIDVSMSEKDVYSHLEHILKTVHHKGEKLIITPAKCRECGFIFRKRSRLKKPGRCPICHSEFIEEPLYTIIKS